MNFFNRSNQRSKLMEQIIPTIQDPDSVIYMVDKNMFKSRSVFNRIFNRDDSAFSNSQLLCEIFEKIPSTEPIRIVLNTAGGELTACEKVLKKLLHHPAGYIVYIRNECFSAGTLIALGAKEIVMNKDSYLGKIDPQEDSKQIVIYTQIEEKYISDKNIYQVMEARNVMNYIYKLLSMIYKESTLQQELILKHLVLSPLPHATTFDQKQCLEELKLNIRSPIDDSEKVLFSDRLTVEKYKRVN